MIAELARKIPPDAGGRGRAEGPSPGPGRRPSVRITGTVRSRSARCRKNGVLRRTGFIRSSAASIRASYLSQPLCGSPSMRSATIAAVRGEDLPLGLVHHSLIGCRGRCLATRGYYAATCRRAAEVVEAPPWGSGAGALADQRHRRSARWQGIADALLRSASVIEARRTEWPVSGILPPLTCQRRRPELPLSRPFAVTGSGLPPPTSGYFSGSSGPVIRMSLSTAAYRD